MKNSKISPWYKKSWGIMLVIMFFPILIPYLIWTETNLNKVVKTIIILFFIGILIGVGIDSNNKMEEGLLLVEKAKTSIDNNNLEVALEYIKQSEELYIGNENPAYKLENEINNYNSDDHLKETLIGLSDDEYEELVNKTLNKNFLNNASLNKYFIEKLFNNKLDREIYLNEIKEKEINDKISKQFNAWNGTHIELTKYIKSNLKNPDSYENIETTYTKATDTDLNTYIVVFSKYKAKNSYGGYVEGNIKAYYDLDGNPIRINDWLEY